MLEVRTCRQLGFLLRSRLPASPPGHIAAVLAAAMRVVLLQPPAIPLLLLVALLGLPERCAGQMVFGATPSEGSVLGGQHLHIAGIGFSVNHWAGGNKARIDVSRASACRGLSVCAGSCAGRSPYHPSTPVRCLSAAGQTTLPPQQHRSGWAGRTTGGLSAT